MPRRYHPANVEQATLKTIGRAVRAGLGAVQTATVAQLVIQAAQRYGVDPTLALAVANQESGLNPTLVNAKSGAAGVMQLEPAAAQQMGVTNLMDPTQNAAGGVAYLAWLLRQFNGDQVAAVAAYDWGIGNVQAAQAQYGTAWLAYAPSETQNYVRAILGVTPADVATAAPPPLTIDNDTGQVIDYADTPNTDAMPSVMAAGIGGTGTTGGEVLLLAGGALALWLASEYL